MPPDRHLHLGQIVAIVASPQVLHRRMNSDSSWSRVSLRSCVQHFPRKPNRNHPLVDFLDPSSLPALAALLSTAVQRRKYPPKGASNVQVHPSRSSADPHMKGFAPAGKSGTLGRRDPEEKLDTRHLQCASRCLRSRNIVL